MSISQLRSQRLKPLLDAVPPGFLVDTRWLKARDIDSKSIHRYVSHGWLEHVIRGVYRRPLPVGVHGATVVSWESVVLSLQWILKYDVHLGGESALDLAGHYHYLSLGGVRRVHLYGEVPTWLKRLRTEAKMVAHRRSLFGDDTIGIDESSRDVEESPGSINVWRWPIKVSSPERAILEALNELRTATGFDSVDKTFESLTMLRPKLLMTLVMACRSIKVRRLFFVFADRHQHAWRKHLDTSVIDFGTGPRALVEGGWMHPTYRIYVPDHLRPRDRERDDIDG